MTSVLDGVDGQLTSNPNGVIEYWAPSYRFRPTPNNRFVPRQVEAVIKECLERQVKVLMSASGNSGQMSYDDSKCKLLALELCSEIKEKVKSLSIPRYKVVLQSVIGEVKGQGAHIASRCLWDVETDNYAAFSIKNQTLFCTVLVFGLYLE